jgi:hypothetical protein
VSRIHTEPRLGRRGDAALAAGALIRVAPVAVFVLAGRSKVVAPDDAGQLRGSALGGAGASDGLPSPSCPVPQTRN